MSTPDQGIDELVADQAALLRPAPADPGSVMLATAAERRGFGGRGLGPDWIFERKLDGVRAVAIRDGERVRLLSRTGRSLGAAFPELLDALAAQDCADFVVDGEIVAMHHGVTDFGRLQQRLGVTDPGPALRGRVQVTYFVFDLLRLSGNDTTQLPLLTRKALLHEVLRFTAPLRYTTHRRAVHDVDRALARACERGWEGLIAKRADGRYQHRRSPEWLKLKCARAQEFVIGGFTEPEGSRIGFGALLLGYHDTGRPGAALRYAGKVGTGWDTSALRALRARLDELAQSASPFADDVRERRVVHWVRPELVAQIAFTEWTRDSILRHARYQGLRADKRPDEVVREPVAEV